MGFQKLVVEIDSKVVASKLNDPEKDMSSYGLMVEEVKGFLQTREEFRVAWV